MITSLAEWSEAVRARDGKCLRCGTERALVAHHIIPKSVDPEKRLDLDNGETLCSNCHHEHHKLFPGKQGKHTVRSKKFEKHLAAINRLLEENTRLKNVIKSMHGELEEYEKAYDMLNSWDS